MRGPEPEEAHQAGLHGAELEVLRPVVAGGSAEQAQYAKARARTGAVFATDAVAGSLHGAGGGRRMATLDVRSPQVFVAHPRIVQLLDPGPVGLAPHLPGRMPAAGWDGEPGATAPFGGSG